MRVFIPRHISWWMFNMSISMWPINVTLIQLFLLALWVAISLSLWNALTDAWLDNIVAIILVAPIFIIFLVIAFFKMSELSLLPFVTKLIRTNFFDAAKKFYVNYKKVDPVQVAIKRAKTWTPEQRIETKKELNIDKEKMKKLESILE